MTADEIEKITHLQQDGYGYKRIAALTGLSVNTVKSYCRRHPFDETTDAEQDRSCRFCGKELMQTPHKRKHRFCSDACRTAVKSFVFPSAKHKHLLWLR